MTPSHAVALKSDDVSSTMPNRWSGTATGGTPSVSTSDAADPVTAPVPYTSLNGSGSSL